MVRFTLLCLMVGLLLSCAKDPDKKPSLPPKDVIDQTLRMSRDEYKEKLLPSPLESKADTVKKTKVPSIPGVTPILVAPRKPLIGKDKLVSLSVTENVPLKDVLLELGRLSDVDMELDPSIEGGVIITVKNKPFSEVIERISALAGLRYSFTNGVVKVERDIPYLVSYPVDFLNISRSNKSQISVATSVGGGSSGSSSGSSSSGSTGSSGIGSGSTNSVTSEYDGDLWKSIEENLNKILGSSIVTAGKETHTAPTATGTTPPPASTASGAGVTTIISSLSGGGASAQPSAQSGSMGGAGNTQASYITINKQAGVINVFASDRQQDDIKRYLNYVKESTSSQVLIDAKIVEVTLNDEYHTGINWNTIDRNLGVGLKGDFTQNITGITDKMTFGVLDKTATSLANPTDLEAMVNMTQIFGVTRTLSSPRLHAINNQQAVLSFAENQVYFTVSVQTTNAQVTAGTVTTPPMTTVNSTLNTVPIGIILTLQPSINIDTDEITMNIRPTLSRVTGQVVDPAIAYLTASSTDSNLKDLQSTVPVVEVREMDSILKIKNGQIMVIGGLMEERANNNDAGVPFISNIPWVGNLFKSVGKTTNVVQTVIFIKATIVPPNGGTAHEDKEFYKAFTRDPNPLTF